LSGCFNSSAEMAKTLLAFLALLTIQYAFAGEEISNL